MTLEEFEKHKKEILSCPLMADLNEAEAADILGDGVRLADFAPSCQLKSECMYILISGYIQIEKDASDGRRIIMSTAYPPAAVNVAAAFEPDIRLSYLTAQEKVTTVEITEEALQRAVMASGTFATNLIRFLTGRIVFLNKKVSILAGYSAAERLRVYLQENAHDGKVELKMSLTDLADYLGVGRASLYRAFDSMTADGSIERCGRYIYLKKDSSTSSKALRSE